MKRKIVCIALMVITILVASTTIVMAVSAEKQPSQKESQELAVKKRVVPQDIIDEKYDESKYIYIKSSSVRDNSLDEKLKEFDRQEMQSNIEDMEAYAIVNRYSKVSYSTNTLINNKEDDCAFMYKIIDIVKQGKIAEAESDALKAYLSRRLVWLDSNADQELIKGIESVLLP